MIWNEYSRKRPQKLYKWYLVWLQPDGTQVGKPEVHGYNGTFGAVDSMVVYWTNIYRPAKVNTVKERTDYYGECHEKF